MIEADSFMARAMHDIYVGKLARAYRNNAIVHAGLDTILQSVQPTDALCKIAADATLAQPVVIEGFLLKECPSCGKKDFKLRSPEVPK